MEPRVNSALAIALPSTISFCVELFLLLSLLLFGEFDFSFRIQEKIRRWFGARPRPRHIPLMDHPSTSTLGSCPSTTSSKRANSLDLAGFGSDWLIFGLMAADFMQTTAGQLSYFWILNVPLKGSPYQAVCTLQGILFCVGDLSSALWSTFICLDSCIRVLFQKDFDSKFSKSLVTGFCFLGPILVTSLIVPYEEPNYPLFDNSNEGWCFIHSRYKKQRVYNHYLYILLCILTVIFGYTAIIFRLIQLSDNPAALRIRRKLIHVLRKVIAYPICFAILFMPITLDRFLLFNGNHNIEDPVTTVLFSLLMFNGFCNTCLYIWRRRILTRYWILLGHSDEDDGGVDVEYEISRISEMQSAIYGMTVHSKSIPADPDNIPGSWTRT